MKSILITGGARRIGKSLAINFIDKGWNVAFTYNESSEQARETLNLIRKKNVLAKSYKLNVTETESIEKVFTQIFDDFGSIDVLVNNAGIYPDKKSLDQIDEVFWQEVIDTNLRSELFCSKEFAKRANEGARIINFASLGAFEIWKQRLPYNVSKAGVIQLTKALALELAPNISVNSVSPGSILIPDELSHQDLAINIKNIPMQRYGNIQDIFDAVYFFATCSSYITGQNINIDGGYHLSNQ